MSDNRVGGVGVIGKEKKKTASGTSKRIYAGDRGAEVTAMIDWSLMNHEVPSVSLPV